MAMSKTIIRHELNILRKENFLSVMLEEFDILN